MLKEETEYSPVRNPSERRGFFVSRVKAFVGSVVFLALVIVLIVRILNGLNGFYKQLRKTTPGLFATC